MTPGFRPVPEHLAEAIAHTEHPPRSGLEEFIRVYGPDRGRFEWDGHTLQQAEERREKEVQSLIQRAQEIADKFGWDWKEVVSAAREEYPELFNREK